MSRMARAVLQAQQDLAAAMPWITRYAQSPGRCQGTRWSAMSFKRMQEARETGETPDTARCKRAAWFRYRALRKTHAWREDGQYCWEHTAAMSMNYPTEQERTMRWVERHPEAVAPVLREYWGETPGEDA